MKWKILMAQIKEEIYDSLISSGLFPKGMKGCRNGTRGRGELLYTDQRILKDRKTRRETYLWCELTTKRHMIRSHQAG